MMRFWNWLRSFFTADDYAPQIPREPISDLDTAERKAMEVPAAKWKWKGYHEYITGPNTKKAKKFFYESIMESGTNFDADLSSKEYHHWNDLARTHAAAWLLENYPPNPRPNHGIGQ